MSSAQLERLKEIFHSARQLAPDQRTAFLDETCGNDAELRREIDALLNSGQTGNNFIADPPAQLAAEAFGDIPSAVGRTIGRYKLLKRIGSGGMGDVYLAERADKQFQMQVAIKLIKRGMDTESVLTRFQYERQILASLDHPNIARLLDGGTTDDDLPYFVMEYIKGERIDSYAREHQLSIDARLELFRQVCAAVTYAHQHLVVHRDLKPSNILVTAEGVPKLLDFGIAKIIQSEDGGAGTLATITVVPIMTPEYASPEQIQGTAATTLSDVYSLGGILYELLSGRPPHRLKTRSAQEIAEAITRSEIEKPSVVADRAGDAKQLRGDLDNIVLKAMRKEESRRYRSVEQFSEDIRRYLTGRPVIARPDTVAYRAGKFVQRNKLGVAAAALVFLTLVGGIIATTWQARRARAEQARAERRFNDVRKLANSVLFDYHDAIKNLPGSTKVRERLVKDALNYLDSLAGEAQGDPALQRELAAAYERVGDVRGGESSGSLGDLAGAVESYTKAFAIREALVALNPDDAQARRDFASSHQKLGYRMLDTGEARQGLDHLREALALYLGLTREQPANSDLRLELADTYNRLGQAMRQGGDLVGPREQYHAALEICEKLAARNPSDQRYRRALWTCHERIADALWLQDDVAGAIEANSKVLALGEALIADDPLNADYRRGLVLNYQQGGDYRKRSDKHGALEHFRRAAALNEELLAADPANALTRKDLGHTHKRIADFLANLEDNAQALVHFRRALEIAEKLVADAPADLTSRFRAAICGAGVASMQARLGEVESALRECRKSIAVLQEITEDPTNMVQQSRRAEAHEYLGYAYKALAASPKSSASETRQHMSAARDMFRQGLNVLEDLRNRGILIANDEIRVKNLAGEIAKCEKALGK